jgi:cell division protein FtsI (penicillin-binding protein 3)
MRNRAVTDIFEPGSTVKPFTLSLALQSGIFTPDTKIPTSPGVLVLDRRRIRDIRDYGVLTLANVLVKSSNIGTAKIALELNPSQLVTTLQSVGFGQLTGVELPGERSGVLQSKERWRLSEHATLSYGYGLSVTALQLARAYMVLANGGVLKPITIRRREELPRGERVLPSDVVGQINQMLEHVVVKGTGQRARLPSYRVAGKTGTVRKINPEGGYLEGHYLALFAGFAPANEPQFVAVVMIDDPRGEFYYGGQVAAPVFRDIMATALRLYSIPGDIEPAGREVVVMPQLKQSGA